MFVVILLIALLIYGIYHLIISDDDNSSFRIRGNKKEETPLFEIRGKQGEETCIKVLNRLLDEDEYLFTNLLIPTRKDRKTEIDAVVVSRKGAFCIEIKKWVGHIIGNETDQFWIQQYDDPSKEDKNHRNPYLQNQKHCDSLKRLFNGKYEFENIVLFPEIEDRSSLDSEATFDLNDFVRCYRRLANTSLKYHQIKEICEKLKDYQASEQQLQQFRENIAKKNNG